MQPTNTIPTNEAPDSKEPVVSAVNPLGSPSRQKKILLALPVLVIVIAGFALWPGHKQYPKDDQENFKYEASVEITDSGIVPSYATIKPDTRVYFGNTGKPQVDLLEANAEGLQSGSADAETADAYAGPIRELNVSPASPKKDKDFLTTGKISPFSQSHHIFTSPGTYIFYDVNNPTHNITIVVQKG